MNGTVLIDLTKMKRCQNSKCNNFVFNNKELFIDSTQKPYLFCESCIKLFNNMKMKGDYLIDIDLNEYM